MTPATQKLASDVVDIGRKVALGLVLMDYDLGASLYPVMQNEPKYGSDGMQQIARFTNYVGDAQRLYQLALFSQDFDRALVKSQVQEPLENGRWLETGHFLALLPVKSSKARLELLAEVRQESLSVRQLATRV